MKLLSNDIQDQAPIDPRFAFGRLTDDAPMAFSDNLSPHLKWLDFPETTQCFALMCIDPDVPSVADDVNQPGRIISKDLPRVDFCHWAMTDIPLEINELETGSCGRSVITQGKQNPPGPVGVRQGLNDYTEFMSGDPALAGQYFGYDGPCPPWNDELIHRYIFTVYALSAKPKLPEPFTGHELIEALDGLVLDHASLMGTYSLFKK